MLKMREILFWKYIPNIPSDYETNPDFLLHTSNISFFNDKSVMQLKEYRFLCQSNLFWFSKTNHYDSSSSLKSFPLCSSLVMAVSMELFSCLILDSGSNSGKS